jgi:hypothetical protein
VKLLEVVSETTERVLGVELAFLNVQGFCLYCLVLVIIKFSTCTFTFALINFRVCI